MSASLKMKLIGFRKVRNAITTFAAFKNSLVEPLISKSMLLKK